MKRKISIAFLIAIITTMMSLVVVATELPKSNANDIILISPRPQTQIKVQLDGDYLDFTDENGNVVNPEIINDRTMVPMRKIFETFEAEVGWDGETRTVVATTEEKEITLTIDSNKAKLKNLENNEEKEIELDAAPVILNDRTMVPVRFIAESLEKEVGWDAENRTVIIIDFDKIAKDLEERVPALQKLFEIEVETLESFKSTSEITGEIRYKDSEDKSNNETVEIDGELKLNVNKEKNMEMYIDLEFDGKGTIYDSLKEAGTDKIGLGIVIVDGKTYMMMKQDENEVWMDAGVDAELSSSLDSLQMTTSPKSYSEYVEIFKTSLGELNINTYASVQFFIDIMEGIFNEDTLNVSGSESKKTVKMEIDFKDVIAKMIPQLSTELDNLDMKISMVEKIQNKKVENAEIDMEMKVTEPDTKESFELVLELDMKYNNTNKDFEIKTPKVTAE